MPRCWRRWARQAPRLGKGPGQVGADYTFASGLEEYAPPADFGGLEPGVVQRR
jgi:hypothetical protein